MPNPKAHNPRRSASGVPVTATEAGLFDPPSARQCRLFLAKLSQTGDIVAAAEAAGADDNMFFNHRQMNVGFSAEWDAAFEISLMRLQSVCVATALKILTAPSGVEPRLLALYHRLALSLLAARRLLKKDNKFPGSGSASPINSKAALLDKLNQIRIRNEEIKSKRVQ